MSEPKTRPNLVTVDSFIDKLDDERQFEVNTLIDIMEDVTGKPPVMWGSNIVGFDTVRLKYASGKELDWPPIAFSPRKGKLVLYLTEEADKYTDLLDALGGKYKTSKACIYLRKLSDVDTDKLRDLIEAAYEDSKRMK